MLKQYLKSMLWKIGKSKLYEQYVSIYCPCKKWELYHSCDDPDILPQKRLITIPNNCSTYLSGYCLKDYVAKLYEWLL